MSHSIARAAAAWANDMPHGADRIANETAIRSKFPVEYVWSEIRTNLVKARFSDGSVIQRAHETHSWAVGK
ncbi:MAG: hypothetical protein OXG72_00105 [Acidobacteria bacterium]|nr:hypothetical protein [Acidobacteriota bacterium]